MDPVPIYKSRTVAVLGVLLLAALVRILSRYLPVDVAKAIADAITADAMAGLAAAGALAGAYFRARIGKSTIPKMIKPPAGPGAAILLALALSSSCAATWPSTCSQAAAGVACRCGQVPIEVLPHPSGKPRPAGRIVILCDGVALPITIDADSVGKPVTP